MREGGRGGGWKERGREGKKGEKGEKGRRREEAKAGKKEEKEGVMSVKSRSNHTKEERSTHVYLEDDLPLQLDGRRQEGGIRINRLYQQHIWERGGREGETVLTSI